MDDNNNGTDILGPELRKLLEDTVAQDSKAMEQEFDNIIDGMIQTGMIPEESRQAIVQRITEDITGALMVKFVSVLDDDDKKRLKELYVSGLSEYQQLQVVLKLYHKKAGEHLEETMIDLYDQAIKNFIAEYHNLKVSMEQVVKLSEDECDKIDAMIEEGQWDEALAELDRLTNGRTGAPSETPPQQPQPSPQAQPDAPPAPPETPVPSSDSSDQTQSMSPQDLNSVVELLRAGKYEEAKQAMDNLSAE